MTTSFALPGEHVSVTIEDDGSTGYAYFLRSGSIEGFVWLYNHPDAPSVCESASGHAATNPPEFVSLQAGPCGNQPDDFQCIWTQRDGVQECAIYVQGHLTAVLGEGDKPGWCRNASKDGPFALAL